jgi:hypothetical protein
LATTGTRSMRELVAGDDEVAAHVEVERQGRAVAAFAEGEALDDVVGQHGDLVARHVHRGQALRAMPSSAESRPKPRPGAAMWMPMRQPPSVGVTEKASSISVVAASSMEKARTSASGRPVRHGRRLESPGRRCPGEVFEEEAVQVVSRGSTGARRRRQQVGRQGPLSTQAASSALVSGRLRSGL